MRLIRLGIATIVSLACALGAGGSSPAHAVERGLASPFDQKTPSLAIDPADGALWLLGDLACVLPGGDEIHTLGIFATAFVFTDATDTIAGGTSVAVATLP